MPFGMSFVLAIRDRLGEKTSFELAKRACYWLDKRSPIDPCWDGGDVHKYLASLGLPDSEPDGDYTTQSCREKAAKVWDEMVAAIMMEEPLGGYPDPIISINYRSYNETTGKIYFELVVCWDDYRYEESGDIDAPSDLARVLAQQPYQTNTDVRDRTLRAYANLQESYYRQRYNQNPYAFREAYGPQAE